MENPNAIRMHRESGESDIHIQKVGERDGTMQKVNKWCLISEIPWLINPNGENSIC